jgi:hypothetical protein
MTQHPSGRHGSAWSLSVAAGGGGGGVDTPARRFSDDDEDSATDDDEDESGNEGDARSDASDDGHHPRRHQPPHTRPAATVKARRAPRRLRHWSESAADEAGDEGNTYVGGVTPANSGAAMPKEQPPSPSVVTTPSEAGKTSTATAAAARGEGGDSLYAEAMLLASAGLVPCRRLRVTYTGCVDNIDFLARLHCVREASNAALARPHVRAYVGRNMGRVLAAAVRAAGDDPAPFEVGWFFLFAGFVLCGVFGMLF